MKRLNHLLYLTIVALVIASIIKLNVPLGKEIWPFLTLVLHAILISIPILIVIEYFQARDLVTSWLSQNATFFSLILAAAAVVGSLFYSDIAMLEPCRLCWYQRIFMYPLVLLLGIAYYKKQEINDYILSLSGIGILISGYHYVSQFFTIATSCGLGDLSCSQKLIFYYGYITIPLMALSIFLGIFLLQFIEKK